MTEINLYAAAEQIGAVTRDGVMDQPGIAAQQEDPPAIDGLVAVDPAAADGRGRCDHVDPAAGTHTAGVAAEVRGVATGQVQVHHRRRDRAGDVEDAAVTGGIQRRRVEHRIAHSKVAVPAALQGERFAQIDSLRQSVADGDTPAITGQLDHIGDVSAGIHRQLDFLVENRRVVEFGKAGADLVRAQIVAGADRPGIAIQVVIQAGYPCITGRTVVGDVIAIGSKGWRADHRVIGQDRTADI